MSALHRLRERVEGDAPSAAGDTVSGPARRGASRRSAFRRMAFAGALAAMPWGDAMGRERPLPAPQLLDENPERFWTRLRKEQFLLGEDRAFLNPGSLGVMSRPVLKAVTDSLTRGAEYATDDVVRWGYETLEPERKEMAEFLGCRMEELAFTHNCTEAMSFIAQGLELKAGDEVLTTDQEHGGGSACWRVRESRHGIVVRVVELPLTPRQPEELVDRLISAIGPRTRVLSFSGITSPTGLVMPVQAICRAARDKGVISVVDGAHMDGQVVVNLRELGCDYFAGSPHKWLFAPPGCGLLYGRDSELDRLWPCVATSGWDNKSGHHAARFMMVGTNNRSTIDGMMAGMRFCRSLGETRVYDRMHQLARLALKAAQQRAYMEPVTPDDSRFFQSMISIRFKGDRVEALGPALKKAGINAIGGPRARLSFHIHSRPSDIAKYFEVCDRVFGSRAG